MKALREFLRMAQNDPHVFYGAVAEGKDAATYRRKLADGTLNLKKEILAQMEKAHFFVLSRSAIFPDSQMIGGPTGPAVAVVDSHMLDLDVAPPFETCWLQFADGELLSGVKTGAENVFGVFIHERGPHEYLFGMVLEDPSSGEMLRLKTGYCSPDSNHEIWHIIALFLQPFNRKNVTIGIEKTNDRVKYKKGDGEKVHLKIRKIVHVLPKAGSRLEKEEIERSKRIDWSHRWSVRGHWRKVKGIGKNRAEEYCVQGFTYVMDHEKGPDEVALVKKTRVVLDTG